MRNYGDMNVKEYNEMNNSRGINMDGMLNDQALTNTENRTLKWFLGMFYIIFFLYEFYFQFIYIPYRDEDSASLSAWNYVIYILMILLLPVSKILVKKGKLFLVKYVFVASYLCIALINEIYIYFNSGMEYQSGNVVEVVLVLFAPIFVNSHFFWFVSIGIGLKYGVAGLLFHSSEALFPLSLVFVISGVSYIILRRFQVYVGAIETSYNNQLTGIVRGVIATIELKDPYTRGHSERVAFYAKSLAAALNRFSQNELNAFNYACLLHDIGKVNIPDSILMKPTRLTTEEYEVIKTHPVSGAEAIQKVDGLKMDIDVIKYHHERWDGQGYPEQLSGEEIPLLARVVAIADAFDAMTSSRSYRNALALDDAYRRIIEGKGTQFDPKLVEVFQAVFPDWVKFHQSYKWADEAPLQHNVNGKEVSK
ncbi:HD-GYP domain-containing protein [Mesobacillus foraminis]|uniref:HD-GYP domain-containing protein n=1 Tax=Mesobacillus foraminis TaxID=279826 RepID=UPI0020365D2C|nr:HD-GYP domain-containing protein [Mesobacillus foraminis]